MTRTFSRRIRWLIVLLVLLTASTVSARRFLQAQTCVLDSETTLSGTLFVLCQELVIDGDLDGNLIGAAMNATIYGNVYDGVYLVGGQLDVYGTVHEDLHYAGPVLNLHSSANFESIHADLFAVTMSTHIAPEITLPGSILAAGYQLLIEGDVNGEVNFWGSALELGGQIGGDLTADVGDTTNETGTAELETLFLFLPVELNLVNSGLRLAEDAQIGGDLRYRAPTEGDLSPDMVQGELFFDEIITQPQIADLSDEATLRKEFRRYVGAGIREFATLAVVGMMGLVFAPVLTQAPIRNLRRRPLTSLGVGTLTFLLSFPVVVIAVVISVLVVLTLTLFQLGNLILASVVVLTLLDVGGASLFYFVAIFVARSIVSLAFGRLLLRLIFEDDGSSRFLYLSLIFGALLIGFAVSLPFVGWLINALVLFLGLGAIVNLLQAQLRTIREGNGYNTYAVPLSERPHTPINVQHPKQSLLPSQRPRHDVGLDNLPEGFVWWDD